MNRKYNFLASVLLFLVMLLVAGCGGDTTTQGNDANAESESGGQGQEQEIKIAHNLPAEHATGIYFEILAEKIEELTQDTSIHLKPQLFPNGQLYTDAQLPDALTTGGVEIGQLNTGFLAGGDAEPLHVLDLPFLFTSWEAEWAAEDGEYGKLFGEQMEKMGMKLLGWPAYGTIELYGKEPIQVPEDLSGMKMRGFGLGASKMLEEMGASPVSMSSQEIYQAMEHGAIDGYTTGPSSVVDRSLFEVTEYGTDMTVMYIPFQGAANLQWWESLPEDVRGAIIEASEIAQEESRQAAKESDVKYKEKLAESGVEQYKPTPEEYDQWVEAAAGRYTEFLEKSGEVGEKMLESVEEMNEQYPAQ